MEDYAVTKGTFSTCLLIYFAVLLDFIMGRVCGLTGDENMKKTYCINCRKETTYTLKKQEMKKVIKDKEYSFLITIAICNECGEEISIPGLLDQNIKEIDLQYREKENLITIEEINKLLKIYDIGKGPLALVLGFGEVDI